MKHESRGGTNHNDSLCILYKFNKGLFLHFLIRKNKCADCIGGAYVQYFFASKTYEPRHEISNNLTF